MSAVIMNGITPPRPTLKQNIDSSIHLWDHELQHWYFGMEDQPLAMQQVFPLCTDDIVQKKGQYNLTLMLLQELSKWGWRDIGVP